MPAELALIDGVDAGPAFLACPHDRRAISSVRKKAILVSWTAVIRVLERDPSIGGLDALTRVSEGQSSKGGLVMRWQETRRQTHVGIIAHIRAGLTAGARYNLRFVSEIRVNHSFRLGQGSE